jgi:hypothetical protein
MIRRARRSATIAALAVLANAWTLLAASPPPELVDLERQVSLQLAHVRDNGPTDPVKRQQLFDASQLDQKGEAQIKSGDYKSAEESFQKAQAILRQLSD